MKKYVKPDVYITEFQLNSAIATCEPTNYYPEEQDLTCSIVSGDVHGVFYSDCSTNASTAGRLVSFNGVTYFIWYDGTHSSTPPSAEAQILIEALGVQQGEHAGPADAEIISIVNHS